MCLFVFQLAVASHCYSLLPSEGQWCVCLSSNWQWQVTVTVYFQVRGSGVFVCLPTDSGKSLL